MGRYKILFIARRFPSYENPISGIFIKEHAKSVSLYGDVFVITSKYKSRLQSLYNIDDNKEDGIRVLRVHYRKSPIPKTTYLLNIWGIFCAFRTLIREVGMPDIIHAHVYTTGIPAVLLGKHYKIPVVISEHFSSFPRGMIKGFEKLKARFALNRANFITTVSQDLSNHIRSYGIRNKFKVVPNAVNTQIFYPSVERKKEIPKKLLLVALFNPIKGIPYLLCSLAVIKKKRDDFILDIVGDGPYRKQYEKYANKIGIKDKVNFHGLKTKLDVAQFMRNADIFVLPSIWENLPCVLIEAMASGLPIIATSVGGIPEIVNKNIGLLVPPKDIEALSSAIDFMLDYYKDYSKDCIASYSKNLFSYETIGKEFNEIYCELKSDN